MPQLALWQLGPPPADREARGALLRQRLAGRVEGLDRLADDPDGRPRLPPGKGDLSLSHAGQVWLCAHVDAGRVGVDVEPVRARPRALEAALAQFPRAEAAQLQTLSGPARWRGLLRLWCAREALYKAHGAGLAAGFGRAEFRLGPRALRLVACDPTLGEPGAWRLREFVPARGYVGVVVWCGGPRRLVGRDARP